MDIKEHDDNAEIMALIESRLKIGLETYGHGVKINDPNIKKYGVKEEDWNAMAEEEVMDGLIYAAAAILRNRRLNELRREHVMKLAAEGKMLRGIAIKTLEQLITLECRCAPLRYDGFGKEKHRDACESCEKYNDLLVQLAS
jgi:2,3-bisphosphoglycerate-independent phosphoglycerate mutase